jgi:hypothetical protein
VLTFKAYLLNLKIFVTTLSPCPITTYPFWLLRCKKSGKYLLKQILKYLVTNSFPNPDQTLGGGVGFYVRNDLPHKLNPDLSTFENKTFESLTIEININKRKTLLTNIYRSPENSITNLDIFNNKLDTLISQLVATSATSYIFLDSNINLLKLANSPQAQNYHETILNNVFLQLIFNATRFSNNDHYSLIDHIITNASLNSTLSGTLIEDISDHLINFTTIKNCPLTQTKSSKPTRNFSEENKNTFRTSLRNLDWSTVLTDQDVNSSYEKFWYFLKLHLIFTSPKNPSSSTRACIKSTSL